MTVLNPQKLDAELFVAGLPLCIINRDYTVANAYVDTSQCPANQVVSVQSVLAAHNGALPLGYVDCTTQGTKVVGLVGRSGFAFLPTYWRLVVRASQGSGTPPTVSMGVVGPNYTDLVAATSLVFATYPVGRVFNQFMSGNQMAVLATTAIFINVTVAASAGPYTLFGQFFGETVGL